MDFAKFIFLMFSVKKRPNFVKSRKSKCPKLIGVAASAGNSTNFKKESSASLSRGNSYSQFFTTNLPTITLDVDQVGYGKVFYVDILTTKC